MSHTQLKLLVLALFSSVVVIRASAAPIVQPGAPGDNGRILSAEEAVQITDTSYSPADANFMQMMIPHHQQALEMADLVEGRTNRPELVEIAGRRAVRRTSCVRNERDRVRAALAQQLPS